MPETITESVAETAPSPWGRITGGRAVVARGITNAYAQMLAFFLLLSLIGNCWLGYALLTRTREHAREMQDNFTIWRQNSDGTTDAHRAAEFRTGASEVQMNAVAWRVVSLIESAASDDVRKKYDAAKAEMTETLAKDFEETFGERAAEIAQLGIYSTFDKLELRQAVKEDFPAVERLQALSRYDRIVVGERRVMFAETREPVNKKRPVERVAYYVRLIPLHAPEVAHPEGLLVDTIIPLKMKEVQGNE